jgi:hypothetical protein
VRAPEQVWKVWRAEKSCLYRDSNSHPLAVPPIGSRYTDCVIPATLGLNSLASYVGDCEKTLPEINHCNFSRTQFAGQYKGEGTPRKVSTATRLQFPRIIISLSWTHVTEWSSPNWGNCIDVSSICDAPFSNMCSTQADKNSRKLRLPVSLVCPRPYVFFLNFVWSDCKERTLVNMDYIVVSAVIWWVFVSYSLKRIAPTGLWHCVRKALQRAAVLVIRASILCFYGSVVFPFL